MTAAADDAAPRVQVHDPGPALALVEGGGEARAVIWPGTGARLRTMHRISLANGGRTVALRHPSEAVYYVISGGGRVREAGGGGHEVREGSMVLVEAGTTYVFESGPDGAELVGGPCPPDPSLYEHLAAANEV